MARKPARLPPPYLKRLWFDADREVDWDAYPFCLPLFRRGEFEMSFETPVTILVGENGTGKSTLLEGIASLAGFDEAGGGKGYSLVDHSRALDKSGVLLGTALRAGWLPKLTDGWFFRAESFFTVARSLDVAALDVGEAPPDFLSASHGEGFLDFFKKRVRKRALYLLDEPEAALSPIRQIEFMKFLRRMGEEAEFQIVLATHAPLLMAWPGATLLRLQGEALTPARLEDTDHFRLFRDFCEDPKYFMDVWLET